MGERWNRLIQKISRRCVCHGEGRFHRHKWKDGACAICGEPEMVSCPVCDGRGSCTTLLYDENAFIFLSGCNDNISYIEWVCPHCEGTGGVLRGSLPQDKQSEPEQKSLLYKRGKMLEMHTSGEPIGGLPAVIWYQYECLGFPAQCAGCSLPDGSCSTLGQCKETYVRDYLGDYRQTNIG